MTAVLGFLSDVVSAEVCVWGGGVNTARGRQKDRQSQTETDGSKVNLR